MSERQRSRRILRRIGGVLAGLGAIIVILLIAAHMALNTDRVAVGMVQKDATSKDGTIIAYEQTGTGPAVILVAAALADRGGARRLAGHLLNTSRSSTMTAGAGAKARILSSMPLNVRSKISKP